MYNAIEDGAAWPREVLRARAVASPKTKGVELNDPLAFRLLVLTSAAYCLWARTRLGDLQQPQETWSDERLRA
eukprot:760735-Alexandrium_andersonii.AAC.1